MLPVDNYRSSGSMQIASLNYALRIAHSYALCILGTSPTSGQSIGQTGMNCWEPPFPTIAEAVESATNAGWLYWLVLFAVALLVSLASGNPYPMALAIGLLLFGLLGTRLS